MAFTIPNDNQSGITDTQATWMQTDVDTLVQGFTHSGVLVGCLVAAQSSPNMSVQVASGSVQIAGVIGAVTGTTLSITAADASAPRVDLVVCSNTGVLSVVTGMAAVQPTLPALPASSVALAAVYVEKLASSIVALNIVDKRVIVLTPTGIDVTDYGAVADGMTDSTAAIQAAVNAALAAATMPQIFFPSGESFYKVYAPILIHGVTMPVLFGESMGADVLGTTIRGATGTISPIFHTRGATAATNLTLTTNLATGPGQALTTNRATMSTDTFIDFTETTQSLQGLAAFSVQLFIKIASYTTDFQDHILESSGSLTNVSPSQCFTLKLDTSGHLIGGVNVGGTLTEITSSGALSLATVYYLELSYDGSHVRLFYGTPGNTTTLAGTVTTSGTVRQGLHEQLSSGGVRQDWPHGSKLADCMSGVMDSIMLSSTARHTSTFTAPTTKHTFDANTIWLENFDNETADFSIVQTAGGPAYLPKYGQNGSQGQFLEMHHFNIYGTQSAIHHTGTIQAHFHHLTLEGGMYGINSGKDTFTNTYGPRLYFDWGGAGSAQRGALIVSSQGGINHYEDMRFTGYPVDMVLGSGGGRVETTYHTGGSQIIPILARQGNWKFDSVVFSNEDNPSSTYQCCLYTNNGYGLKFENVTFECFAAAVPAVIVQAGCLALTFDTCNFAPNSGASAVIDVASVPARPIIMNNCTTTQVSVPWGIAATFANKPTAPVEGDLQVFTDSNTSTWGATIAGGSSSRVLGRYNGTNWTVEAK